MSFDAREFVEVADHLRASADAGACPADAARPAAIGRYYYAVLLAARDVLARTSPMPVDTSDTSHRWVLQSLRASADSSSQLLSGSLNTLRTTRNRAEYGDDLPRLEEEVRRVATSCRKALGQVEALQSRLSR